MIQIVKHGEVIHKSRNLRGILDHARREPVDTIIAIRRGDDSASVRFIFYDKSRANVEWASWLVLCQWIQSRHRSWGEPYRMTHRGAVTVWDYFRIMWTC